MSEFENLKEINKINENLLKEAKQNAEILFEQYKHAENEAVKNFVRRLCMGRTVSDPVVVAVKNELVKMNIR